MAQVVKLLGASPITSILYEDVRGSRFIFESNALVKLMRRYLAAPRKILAHRHSGNGTEDAATIEAVLEGADGVWAGFTPQAAGGGHGSAVMFLTNLVRAGNPHVERLYQLEKLVEVARRMWQIHDRLWTNPLGALDLKLREAMQIEIRRIQQELSITTVYVTHDQTEATNMSDRIVVMNEGVIEQLGTAEEIYRRPASRFVADFVGQINLLSGTLVGEEGDWVLVDVAGARIRAPRQDGVRRDAEVSIGVRPELFRAVAAASAPAGMNVRWRGGFPAVPSRDNLLHVYVALDDGKSVVLEARPQMPLARTGPRSGSAGARTTPSC